MAEKKNRKNIRKVSSYTRLTTQRSLSVAVFAGTRTYTYARASEESERTPAGDLIRSRRRRRGRELRRRYAKAKGPKLRLARAPWVYNLHIAQAHHIYIPRLAHLRLAVRPFDVAAAAVATAAQRESSRGIGQVCENREYMCVHVQVVRPFYAAEFDERVTEVVKLWCANWKEVFQRGFEKFIEKNRYG